MHILSSQRLAASLVTGSMTREKILPILKEEAVISSRLYHFIHKRDSDGIAAGTPDPRVIFCVFSQPNLDTAGTLHHEHMFDVYMLGGFDDAAPTFTRPGELIYITGTSSLFDINETIMFYEDIYQQNCRLNNALVRCAAITPPVEKARLNSNFDHECFLYGIPQTEQLTPH